ncbi:uncharacterized protein N0V89_006513 [Didymosphaeria variabile]|uniref:Wax synthase domain-containing protein n=1 Tax=Didymosphaeria variabile TaxID=1932322 RepID=A0A9W9C8K6_9PLEO|nr:uncharacterized protein N0V89_006513 [Didymosphaeria variabile]KAJ4351174.1 hypothetical protein N0V89_006513 [Didymosphaeria variabile]
MRARWASLQGGFSFTMLLQYIDLALISKRSHANHSSDKDVDTPSTLWQRFKTGWNAMWSFRRINTPSEAKNVPHFSSTDPIYTPPRSTFILRQALNAAVRYLVLDLLAQRKPPSDPQSLFHPSLIPFFTRLGSVTLPQIKLRVLSIAGFAVTFYCIIQGFTSFAAALALGCGLSDVKDWRPAFGSVSSAYSLKNVWG